MKEAHPSQYRCRQIFGSEEDRQKPVQDDTITALRFNHSGDYFAIGDEAGRVILFRRGESSTESTTTSSDQLEQPSNNYGYASELVAHSCQVDPLKNSTFSGAIKEIQWLQPQGKHLKFLTANSRSIKIWKAGFKTQHSVVKSSGDQMNAPVLGNPVQCFQQSMQQVFPAKHRGRIQSFKITSNEHFLLSLDERTAYLWQMQKPTQPFILCDLEMSMEANDSLLVNAAAHSSLDSVFAIGTTTDIRLVDTRISPSFNRNTTKISKQYTTEDSKEAFRAISACSDLKFSENGKYLYTRDLFSLKIWDLTANRLLKNIPIQEPLKDHKCDLLTRNSFNRFRVAASQTLLATGSFNDGFHVYDILSQAHWNYRLDFSKKTLCEEDGVCPEKQAPNFQRFVECIDFAKDGEHLAMAAGSCIFTFRRENK